MPFVREVERIARTVPTWTWDVASVVLAILAALIIHRIAIALASRTARRSVSPLDDILVRRLGGPSRWLLIGIALVMVEPSLHLTQGAAHAWTRVAGLALPALFGWTVIAVLGVSLDLVLARADVTVENNLDARRRRTRAAILNRVATFIILLITFCLMLMSIPAIRSIGVTLIASAGLAGLAVGAAAQPALKNLIAGVQMAFTEPIRIDDVVIVDNEWGRIEDIHLTFVSIRLWDERRLIVPVSKFLEESFQNWTRDSAQLLGSIFWYLDPAADIPRLREKLGEVVRANGRWDGRFFNLQVTDSKADGSIEVRALVTAKDSSTAFDLRCDVREAMLAFIRAEMPEAIMRRRGEVALTSTPAASLA